MGVNETLVDWWRKNISPIPYNTWKWIGKNFTLYTTPYFETYDHREKLKQQLQRSFEKCQKKYGKNFWKEEENDEKKKQNTSPFRVKKVGDKYEYDFVSYDEWENLMSNLEDENGLDGK